MTPARMLAMGLAGMIIIQVILGGYATLLGGSTTPHVVWGVISFVVLLLLVALIAREFTIKSAPFRVSIVAVVDFVIQGVLGFVSFKSNDALLIHLTNAFILAALITTTIGMMARIPAPMKSTTSSAAAPA